MILRKALILFAIAGMLAFVALDAASRSEKNQPSEPTPQKASTHSATANPLR